MKKKKMFYGANKIIFENAKALRNNLTARKSFFMGQAQRAFSRL
jgi:hypothetical protein